MSESGLPRTPPGDAVGSGVDVVTGGVPEDPAVSGYPESGDVLNEHPHEHRRDGNRTSGLGGATLQRVRFMDSSVVRPVLSRGDDASFEIVQPKKA